MEIIVACVVSFVATALLGGKVILPALRRLTCLGGNILLFPGNGAGKDG